MVPVKVSRTLEADCPRALRLFAGFCVVGIAMAGHGQADHAAKLTSELKDASWTVRLDAAYALSQLKDPGTVGPLIAALKDSDSDVRRTAATALGGIKDLRAVKPLITTLKDPDAQVRCSALTALGEIEEPEAVAALIPVLKDSDANVRRNAADWLGRFNDSRAVEPLIAALKDSDFDVQLVAARALDAIKDARANEPLMQALMKREKPVVGGAYRFFIGQGKEGSEDALIAALTAFGNKDMALDFLNCGNPALAEAGRAWAKTNGYLIVTDPKGWSTIPVLWGSERMVAMAGQMH